MDKYGEYKQSKSAINLFLFSVPDKPNGALKDKNLFQGHIIFEDCSVEKHSKNSILELNSRIYCKEVVEEFNFIR